MRILYHHRTRSTDAQRIHIQEIVRAFEQLGHHPEIVSLVATDKCQEDAARDAGEAFWKRWARRIPFTYELIQLGYNLVGIPLLLAAVLRGGADFIYERYSLFNFTGVVVSRLCRIPLILEVNSPFALEQARDREIRAQRLARWSERVICNLATRVIAVSTPLARILAAAGVNAERIEVMSNGVSLEKFQLGVASAELARKLGVDGHVVIGFVGWFRNWHGLDLLFRAFHQADLASKGAKLLMIGDGPEMPGLQAYVREHRLEQSVLFTGPVPHAEVPGYLDIVHIAVQPSANEYCCPMKILEYMALGKAIVAPRQENILELLRDGEEAQFFTPGNTGSLSEALTIVVQDPQRSLEMSRRARLAIERRGYLWTSNAQRVIGMVSAAMMSRPRRWIAKSASRV